MVTVLERWVPTKKEGGSLPPGTMTVGDSPRAPADAFGLAFEFDWCWDYSPWDYSP
jgi:hypothetical protein